MHLNQWDKIPNPKNIPNLLALTAECLASILQERISIYPAKVFWLLCESFPMIFQ